jgi:hypothetical protein
MANPNLLAATTASGTTTYLTPGVDYGPCSSSQSRVKRSGL